MNIGLKIQKLRKSEGLSQEQLADILGVSRQAVSKWEAEQSTPDLDKIIAICNYFKVSTDYILLDGEQNIDLAEQQITDFVPLADEDSTYYNADSVQDNAVPHYQTLEDNEKAEKQKKLSGILLAVAVMLYILSLVPVILLDNTKYIDSLGPALMFLMIAIATGLIIYRAVVLSKKSKQLSRDEENERKDNKTKKAVNSCIWSLTVALYFIISFATKAWYVTWVMFLIGAAVQNIAEAVYDLKGGDEE